MKTKVFLAAIALVFSSAAIQAQHSNRRIFFGFSVQPHANWMHADESYAANGPLRLGMEGGLRMDYQFQRFFAFSLGVNLNQTGGNIIYADPLVLDLAKGRQTVQAGTRITYRLQYVEIPVALKFILPEIGYSTWFVETGLDPMFNTHAYINATDNNIEKEPFQQGIGQFNLAWHSALGLKYSLGNSLSLQVSLVYKNTFLDVTLENDIRKPDNSRINQVGLSVGLVF